MADDRGNASAADIYVDAAATEKEAARISSRADSLYMVAGALVLGAIVYDASRGKSGRKRRRR